MSTGIDMNELRRQWMALGGQLDGALGESGERLYDHIQHQAVHALKPLARVNAFEVLCNAGLVAVLAISAIRNAGNTHYLLAVLAILAVWVALTTVGLWQWAAFRRVDFSDPVVVVQNRISSLIKVRATTMKWLILLMPLIWIPLCVVGCQVLLDLDVADGLFDSSFAVILLAWGVWALILLVAARWFQHRARRPSLFGYVIDSLAGKALFEAHRLAEQAGWLEEMGAHSQGGSQPEHNVPSGKVDGLPATLHREMLAMRVALGVLVFAIVCTGAFIAGHVHSAGAVATGAVMDIILLFTLVGVGWQIGGATGAPAEAAITTLIRRRGRFLAALLALAPIVIAVAASTLGMAWFGISAYTPGEVVTIGLLGAVWALGTVIAWRRGAFRTLGTRRLAAIRAQGAR